MAMVSITPLKVRVRTDWFSGKPHAVQLGDELLPILSVARVRDESAAYRRDVGPRTRFEVETPRARFLLTFLHRGRRWLIDGLDDERRTLPLAA